jgi:hypothetical protein
MRIAATAFILALAFAPTGVDARPRPTTQDQQAPADVRIGIVTANFVRLNAILTGIVDEPVARAGSPRALIAALRAKRDRLSAARQEVDQIRTGMAALPPLGGAVGSGSLIVDSLAEQTESYASEISTILDRLGALADANATDQAAVDRGLRAVQEAAVSLVEANGTATRLRVHTFPPGQSQGFQGIAGAASSDATAAILRRAYDMIDSRAAAARLRAAEAEIRTAVAQGRPALEAEFGRGASNPAHAHLIQEVVPLQRQTFDVLSEFGDLAGQAAATAEAGTGPDDMLPYYEAAGRLQQRISAISIEQSALISRPRP